MSGAFTTGQELLLGLGSTLGIVAQFLILVPYLRAAGFRYRPRFDFRDTGLGHTLRLGVWTVLFVIVNQIAYTVVVRLASGGTAAGLRRPRPATAPATRSTPSAFLIMMVPHSIITVSLATAILPRLSAQRRRRRPGRAGRARWPSTLRTALARGHPVRAAAAGHRARRRQRALRLRRRRGRRSTATRRRSRSSAPGWSSSPSTT